MEKIINLPPLEVYYIKQPEGLLFPELCRVKLKGKDVSGKIESMTIAIEAGEPIRFHINFVSLWEKLKRKLRKR